MAILFCPDERTTVHESETIQTYLAERGIHFAQWVAHAMLSGNATQEEVLNAYRHALDPYMSANGYQTADVISVHPQTPNLSDIRARFLREHTHSEDEVRFFVAGQGNFWFHLTDPTETVFCVTCQSGDLLSVPAGYKHWFDLGEPPGVQAIRIFTDAAGWIPHYTDSGIETRYTREQQVSV